MKHLIDLFKLVEITRNQPQYGYGLSGIAKHEISDLAQHHYLTTFISWQLALEFKLRGAKINVQQTMEIALVHDLGELFGGDISFHYGKSNPLARKAAKSFELENIKFLSSFFGNSKTHYLNLLSMERGEIISDEAIIARFADLIECIHYKLMLNKVAKKDMTETIKDLSKKLAQTKDPIVKRGLSEFLKIWPKELNKRSLVEIIRKGK